MGGIEGITVSSAATGTRSTIPIRELTCIRQLSLPKNFPGAVSVKKWTWHGKVSNSLFWPAEMYHRPLNSLVSKDGTRRSCVVHSAEAVEEGMTKGCRMR